MLPARVPGYRPADLDLLARPARWSGWACGRSASATAGSRSSWPTTCRCCTAAARSRRGRAARAAARAPRAARAPASSPSCTRRPAAALARSRAGRALGPGLGGRGHERHAGRAARVPAPARASRARAACRGRASARAARRRPARSAAGASSRAPGAGTGADATERAKALAEQLLERHGVLTREAVSRRAWPGGFAARLSRCCGARGSGPHPARLLRGRPRRLAVRAARRARPPARAARAATRRGRRRPWCWPRPIRQPVRRRPAVAGGRVGPRDARRGRARRARGRRPAALDSRGEREITTVLPEDEPLARAPRARWLGRSRTGHSHRAAGARLEPRRGRAPPTTRPLAAALRESGFVPMGPGLPRSASAPPPAAPGMTVVPGGGRCEDPALPGGPTTAARSLSRARRRHASGASRTACSPVLAGRRVTALRLAAPALASEARRHRVEGSTDRRRGGARQTPARPLLDGRAPCTPTWA